MITLLIMPDQKTYFPGEEPPAAPPGEVSEEMTPTPTAKMWPTTPSTPAAPVNDFGPQGAPQAQPYLGAEQTSPQGTLGGENVPPVAPSGPPVSSLVKRQFPTKIILGILLALVIVLAGYFGFKFFTKKAPAPIQKNTITWWGLWEDASIVTPIIDEYEKANPTMKIDYVRQSSKDYRERLENSLSKGEGPDIFFFHNTWTPMFSDKLDKVPASVMSAGDYSETFYPVIASDATSGTGLVGIPLGYDALTLYINQDIFDAAGKTPPETWDELRETASTLTVKDKDGVITQSGVALGLTENVDHWQEILGLMMIQNGVDLSKPTGVSAEKALDFYTLFFKKDKVWNETMPPSTVAFAAGKVAMIFGPSWRAFEIKEQNPKLRFKAVAPPHLPKENPNEPDVSYATYWLQGVWNKNPQKDAVWSFLKFMSQKDTLEKLFNNASRIRLFGEPYPRVDMAEKVNTHPMIGSIITQAPYAQSWYLAARTFDGPTGINSQINKYFEDAVNAVNSGTTSKKALEIAAQGVSQVLAQFGVSSQ